MKVKRYKCFIAAQNFISTLLSTLKLAAFTYHFFYSSFLSTFSDGLFFYLDDRLQYVASARSK